MNIATPGRMTVDRYLAWALDRPGRYVLDGGVVVRRSPERGLHAQIKAACYVALRTSIQHSGVACFAMPDGMTVRINDRTAFEPDALVHGAPRLADDDVVVENPIIVVGVLSPGTRGKDMGGKLAGYFAVSSMPMRRRSCITGASRARPSRPSSAATAFSLSIRPGSRCRSRSCLQSTDPGVGR